MAHAQRLIGALALLALAILPACTAGGIAVPASQGSTASVTIDINLTLHQPTASALGQLAGYAPAQTTVRAGTSIRFINSDGFPHTATMISGPAFPAGSPFSASAQTAGGSDLGTPWSTGTLGAGASSQAFVVSAPGTYLFGCFFHYGAPMRGVIVAQ